MGDAAATAARYSHDVPVAEINTMPAELPVRVKSELLSQRDKIKVVIVFAMIPLIILVVAVFMEKLMAPENLTKGARGVMGEYSCLQDAYCP